MKKKLNSRSHFLRNGMSPNEWWELYQQAQDINPQIVKVYEFNETEMTITMEHVSGFSLNDVQTVQKLDIKERRNITAMILELYASMFKFNVSEEAIFMHRDFLLPNIMYTEDKNLKLVDPDSFMLIYPKGPNSVFYGNLFDTLICCKEWER